jgi:hypothetical protein
MMKMLQLLLACAILVIPSQLVIAATVVAPGAATLTEGSLSNFYPFGMDGTDPLNQNPLVSQRYQQAYAASVFSGLSSPLTIEGIAFRPDAEYGSLFSTTLSDIQINLSTTSRGLDELTGVFADNTGSDDTVVLDRGALALSSTFTGPDDGPKAFDVYIDLDTPFVYDPAAGNLLLDVRNYAGQVDSSILPIFDAEYSDELWRAYTTNPDVDGVGNPETTFSYRGFGLVTQFTFTPVGDDVVAVPVPGAFLLTTLGLAGLAGHRRRQRMR